MVLTRKCLMPKHRYHPPVDIILPCLNEAEALPWILGRLPEGYRAIVVDNGSTDGSAEIAKSLGATVVYEPRKGFGSASHAGLLAATAEIVVFSDADVSLDPQDYHKVVNPVQAGTFDFVLARRRPTSRKAWSFKARYANRYIAWKIRKLTGYPLHDLGVMRAAKREQLLGLDLQDRRSGYPLEMVLKAKAHNWSVLEVDAPYYPRVGKSKVTGTIRGTLEAVQDMSQLLKKYAQDLKLGNQ